MAKKKKKQTSRRSPNAVQRFARETVGELRKVSWPTRKEAINLTVMVIGVIIAMSAFLGLLDVAFSRVFALIFSI
ncbi:MAG: preprotein translocase subunit SecE [Chloroflexota bacterium]